MHVRITLIICVNRSSAVAARQRLHSVNCLFCLLSRLQQSSGRCSPLPPLLPPLLPRPPPATSASSLYSLTLTSRHHRSAHLLLGRSATARCSFQSAAAEGSKWRIKVRRGAPFAPFAALLTRSSHHGVDRNKRPAAAASSSNYERQRRPQSSVAD